MAILGSGVMDNIKESMANAENQETDVPKENVKKEE